MALALLQSTAGHPKPMVLDHKFVCDLFSPYKPLKGDGKIGHIKGRVIAESASAGRLTMRGDANGISLPRSNALAISTGGMVSADSSGVVNRWIFNFPRSAGSGKGSVTVTAFFEREYTAAKGTCQVISSKAAYQ